VLEKQGSCLGRCSRTSFIVTIMLLQSVMMAIFEREKLKGRVPNVINRDVGVICAYLLSFDRFHLCKEQCCV